MQNFITKWMFEKPLFIIFVGLIIILMLVIFISVKIGSSYQEKITIELPQIEKEEDNYLSISRIRLRRGRGESTECIEINHNGSFREYDCATLETTSQGYLGFDQVNDFFTRFSLDEFNELATSLIGGDTYYTITIETNQGTKTINITPGDGDLGDLGDLIDDIEEEEEGVLDPTPTPGPTLIPTPTPTPTPPPQPTPTPTPTPSITPTPSPTPDPGEEVEPFSCDMIDPYQRSITVSNIVCLPQ